MHHYQRLDQSGLTEPVGSSHTYFIHMQPNLTLTFIHLLLNVCHTQTKTPIRVKIYLLQVLFSLPSSSRLTFTLSCIGNNPPIIMSPGTVTWLTPVVPKNCPRKIEVKKQKLKKCLMFFICPFS